MKTNRWTAVAAAFSILAAADAFAQRGAYRGKLVDEQGNPLEGVVCTAELHGGGGRATSVTTKKNGEFLKAGVPVGNYVVSCDKDGFRPLRLPAQVSSNEQDDLGTVTMYRLAPGELSEKDSARATELLEKFKISAKSDDHQATLASLLELSKMLPDNPEIQFNIASTYEKLGETDKALEFYQKASELKPDFYDAWLGIAGIQGKRKSWPEAAAAMKKAIDVKATDPVAVFTYAIYADNSGDIPTAEGAYRKTLELDPNRALAHYQLGVIEAGKGQNDAAIAHFEKFLELAPTDPQAEAAKHAIETLKKNKTQG